MVSIVALWLPILVSSVLVYIGSSVIHMLLGYHANDIAPVPNEERARTALRELSIPPGDYGIPKAKNMKDMSSPEFVAKRTQGPVAFLTILPAGPVGMGPLLLRWFLFLVAVSVLVAYITGQTLAPGTEYMRVFQIAGAVAFVGYGTESWPQSIWWGRKWSMTLKNTFDALVYALLTAGAFAWLWP
jgi:hypothetical protein